MGISDCVFVNVDAVLTSVDKVGKGVEAQACSTSSIVIPAGNVAEPENFGGTGMTSEQSIIAFMS